MSFLEYVKEGECDRLQESLDDGADINTTDSEGKTALHIAIEKELVECVKVLLQNEADIYIEDNNYKTAEELGEESSNSKIRELFGYTENNNAIQKNKQAANNARRAAQRAANNARLAREEKQRQAYMENKFVNSRHTVGGPTFTSLANQQNYLQSLKGGKCKSKKTRKAKKSNKRSSRSGKSKKTRKH